MDQAEPSDQDILWGFGERREDADLGRHHGLCPRGDRQKALAAGYPTYHFLQILSVTVFEKTLLNQLLTDSSAQSDFDDSCNQLLLFNL